MPSQLERTSAILGEYMLKGWTLTDLHCEVCRATPLMREPPAEARQRGRPNERIQFCALCEGGPRAPSEVTPPAFSGSSGALARAARRGSTSTQDTGSEDERDRTPPANASAPSFEFISPLDPEPPVSRSVSTTSTGPSLAALAGGAELGRRPSIAGSVSSQPPTAPPNRPLPSAPTPGTPSDTAPHERDDSAESAVQAIIAASASFSSLYPPRRASDGTLLPQDSTSASSSSGPRRASASPSSSTSHIHPFSSAYTSNASLPAAPRPRSQIPDSLSPDMRSERVAQSISSYLERGYSLLAENCTQGGCAGVPLVGYPKRKDGSADGRKMCVSCGGAWVDASKMEGMRVMQASPERQNTAAQLSEAKRGQLSAADVSALGAGRIVDVPRSSRTSTFGTLGSGSESPRSRMRRELYETGTAINDSVAQAQDDVEPTRAGPLKPAVLDLRQQRIDSAAEAPITHSAKVSSTILPTPRPIPAPPASAENLPHGPVDDALNSASDALSHTLSQLSLTLTSCMGDPEQQGAQVSRASTPSTQAPFVDIKLHTEAMRDVLDVLERVGRMERAREMRRRTVGPRLGVTAMSEAAEEDYE